MPGWDGAGNFTLTYDWTDDRDNSVKIRADRHDTQDEDFRAGIEACIAKNGENAATGNLDLGSFRFTNAADGTAIDDLATVKQAAFQGNGYGTDGGSANTYTVTLSPAPAAYFAGMTVRLKLSNTNTSASTLNVNTLGAKSIKKTDGSTDVSSGDLVSGSIQTFIYDGTNFQVQPEALNRFDVVIASQVFN